MSDPLPTRLRAIFTDLLGIEAPEPTTDLVDGGYLDSLALVELLAGIESELGVEIPLDELELDHVRTLERLARLVRERRALAATDAA